MKNTGLHITELTMRNPCTRHAAAEGEPCWNIPTDFTFLRAICGKRVRLGGFNGKISAMSLATKKSSNKKEVRA